MNKKRIRGNPIPLIVEDHPSNYNGYPFITLLQYKDSDQLVIVDNVDDKNIDAYVLDLCGPENVNEEKMIEVVSEWWNKHRKDYPISFEFSKLNMAREVSRIYRSFHIEYVTRVIGPLSNFGSKEPPKVRRRRRKPIPPGVIIERVAYIVKTD